MVLLAHRGYSMGQEKRDEVNLVLCLYRGSHAWIDPNKTFPIRVKKSQWVLTFYSIRLYIEVHSMYFSSFQLHH